MITNGPSAPTKECSRYPWTGPTSLLKYITIEFKEESGLGTTLMSFGLLAQKTDRLPSPSKIAETFNPKWAWVHLNVDVHKGLPLFKWVEIFDLLKTSDPPNPSFFF